MTMVVKNRLSYMLLSVTIILSFTFLLAFFVMSDSTLYNRYKEIMSVSPNIALLNSVAFGYNSAGDDVTSQRYQLLSNELDKMEDTYYYQFYSSSETLTQYGDKLHVTIYYVPNTMWAFFDNQLSLRLKSVKPLKGSGALTAPDQVLVDENLYRLLGGDGEESLNLVLPIKTADGKDALSSFKVTGVMESISGNSVSIEEDGTAAGYGSVWVSQEAAKSYDSDYANRNMLVYSQNNIRGINRLTRDLSIGGAFPYTEQEEAVKEIRSQVFIKGVTALILFLLLGVNLYSSFKNALNERRFEIGVKRAIGAGRRDIVKQFFYEGMLVMGANILVSIALTVNMAVIYKFIQRVAFNVQWTVYLTGYSAAMFAVCAFFLSVSFSLIFAYQSTQVEIVKHLKAE